MNVCGRRLLSSGNRICQKIKQISTKTSSLSSRLQYINNERVKPTGSTSMQVINPATGEVLSDSPCSGGEDVNRAVTAAFQAQQQWSKLTALDRGRILNKAARIVQDNKEDLAYIESVNNGKPLWEATFDVDAIVENLEYYASIAPCVQGGHLQLAGGSFGYIIREPLGVCGGIGAWNYPLQMAVWKSAPALACGNSMVFKPSPYTPLTAVMLAEIYAEAGLPPGCFNVIQGEADTGQLLSCHPDVAKMSFTGSVAGGSKVMAACAWGIKHVTLELGGKSALIIFEDADLENAVKGTMNANFFTQGQVCSNASRVYVHSSIYDSYVEKLVSRTCALRVGDPLHKDTKVGAIINKQQADKIMQYIHGAKQQGAEILCGGEFVTPASHLSQGNFITPCVMGNVTNDMTIVQEEVFGPVVTVMTFDTEEEVLNRANNTELGLAGGVFTKDIQRAHRVASAFKAGAIYVNNYNMYPPGLPFGGYKKSGIGRENGLSLIQYYTQEKAVYVEMNDVETPY